MHHPHKLVWKKKSGLMFIRSLLFQTLDQLILQQEFLDLAHTLLYVTIQLVRSDGSELDGGSNVGPVNLFLHLLFRQLDISLNGRTNIRWKQHLSLPSLPVDIVKLWRS